MKMIVDIGERIIPSVFGPSDREFDKDAAASIFADHFQNASYSTTTCAYYGDFMRRVSADCVKFIATSSVTFQSDLSSSPSSSTYGVAAKLSEQSLKFAYALEELGHHREAAREVMRTIEDNLHETNLNIANTILADADVKKLSSRSLIGLIRSSSRAREALPAWSSAYQRSWNETKRKNRNPEALFVGLPKPPEI